jgi:hypothetical protein
MLIRRSNWQTELDRFFTRVQYAKFQYGAADCCIFVADAVLAMTGTDLAGEFRGRYHSRREALDLCKSYSGARTVRSLAVKAFQVLPEVPVSLAQRGDIVLVRRSSDHSLGIISLSGRDIMALSSEGCSRLALSSAVRAWRI